MNYYEYIFFRKYVAEGEEVIGIVHKHIIKAFAKVFKNFFMLIFLPSLFFLVSDKVQDFVNFKYLEIFFLIVFVKMIYDIFDWYNDVWIITNKSVVRLDWRLWSTSSESVNFSSIEGIEIVEDGFIDKILGKGDIVIHKVGNSLFELKDAVVPYASLDEIEQAIKASQKDDSKAEKTKFELILEALTGVVEKFVDENGEPLLNLKNQDSEKVEEVQLSEEEKKEIQKDQNTIDLR